MLVILYNWPSFRLTSHSVFLFIRFYFPQDIEQLKNTKIQFMEELLEIKYKKEEARVELDSLKQQIQEERIR